VIDCYCVSVAATHHVKRGAALNGIPATILLSADGVRDAMRTRSRVDSKLSKMKAEDYVKRADRAKAKRACRYLNDFN